MVLKYVFSLTLSNTALTKTENALSYAFVYPVIKGNRSVAAISPCTPIMHSSNAPQKYI